MRTKDRVRNFGEVFTPEWLVSDMVDMVGNHVSEIDAKVLEPSCGNGNFLVEILQRKMKKCQTDEDVLSALNSLYGIDLLPDNVAECRERLLAVAFPKECEIIGKARKILTANIICGDALKKMEDMVEGE